MIKGFGSYVGGFLLLVVRVSALLSSKNLSVLGKNKNLLVVRNLLKGWKCDVVCLQETKLHNTSSTIVKSLWGQPLCRLDSFGCHSHDWGN